MKKDGVKEVINKNVRRKVSIEDFTLVCEFLAKEGYLDDDWWCEEPTAVERYFNHNLLEGV